MKYIKPIVRVTTAFILIACTGQSRALSGDQEAACGAILCLAGGEGVAACTPYLSRYFAINDPDPQRLFEKRLDFLNLCPADDLPGDVRPMMARDGVTCQPTQLVSYLNSQIRLCELIAEDSDDCEPRGDEWLICAAYYDHEYTTYEPPELHESCSEECDDDGYCTETCTYTWIVASSPAPESGDPLASLLGL